MGFNVSASGDEMVENHEINVTPLVDVMLVLLIIFMVAAPLATVNVAVDLPSSSAQVTAPPEKPLYLSIQEDMTLILGEDHQTTLPQLAAALASMVDDPKQRIYLRADKSISYDNLMQVMNAMVEAGYSHIALVGLAQTKQAQPMVSLP